MTWKMVFLYIAAALCLFTLNYSAGNVPEPGAGEKYVDNRILIKCVPGAPDGIPGKGAGKACYVERLTDVLASKFGTLAKNVLWKSNGNYYIIDTAGECDIEVLCDKMREEPFVVDTSPDYYAETAAVIPNDPYFHFQYALYNTGQVYDPEYAIGNAGADIKAPEGWEWTTGGEDVIIAVLDSGVASDHEDLKNKIVPGYNCVFQNHDTYDDSGHGTFVSSIAAANTDNGKGVAGVSWRSKVMPVKVVAGVAVYSVIADGIRYAADHNARVINMSLGGASASFVLEDACKYAFDKGAVLVASSGNYGWNRVLYPAAYDQYCLAVGASDAKDKLWSSSNYGPSVDVVAPGVNVVGALYDQNDPTNLNSYTWGSGTSFAAPCVSGVAALLIAYKPLLTNTQVMDLIKYTADDINYSTHPGIDDYTGYGRVNLKRLLGPYTIK